MKQLINSLYGITQQGDIFRNDSVKCIESDFSWSMECMDLHRGVGYFENSSVESDSRDKYGVNELADQ